MFTGIVEGMGIVARLVRRGGAIRLEVKAPGDTTEDLKIGDSVFFLNDEFPDQGVKGPLAIGGSPVTIQLYVPDCDAIYNQAVAAGAKPSSASC